MSKLEKVFNSLNDSTFGVLEEDAGSKLEK